LALPLISLYALSGFCALALETVWMREVSLRAGNTVVAATLVIAVFFGAAALGNLWGARRVRRTERPLLLYARFEIAAGGAAAAAFAANQWHWRHAAVWPPGWAGLLGASLLLVGPSSCLSGVSFPMLAEAFVAGPQRRAATGGLFYGANLLGAGAGVAAGSVLLPWWLGVTGAFAVAAGAQVIGGLVAWRIAAQAPAGVSGKMDIPVRDGGSSLPGWLGWVALAA
jgi:spermidine synthase